MKATYKDTYTKRSLVINVAGAIIVAMRRMPGPGRTGALCVDGTKSLAKGCGACAWHGGVRRWTSRGKVARILRDFA